MYYKEEGLLRLQKLINRFGLSPKLVDCLQNDEVYYSYLAEDEGNIGTISHKHNYLDLISAFEARNQAYVYHVIEDGKSLVLLCVTKHKEDWEKDRDDLEAGKTQAYVVNLSAPSLSEFGNISLDIFNGKEFNVLKTK